MATDTTTRVWKILAQMGADAPADTTIGQLGLDSLEELDMLSAIEEEFEVELPIDDWLESEDLFADMTLGRMIETIDRLRR